MLYTERTGLNWVTQTVDKNGTYFGRFGAFALDSAGNPHVAYTDDSKVVKYASWTGTNWDIQTIDTSQSDYSHRVSLAVDKYNTVNLMYGSLSDVKLAVYQDSNWTIQTVTSDMDSLGNIVLDSNGNPHISLIEVIQGSDAERQIGAYSYNSSIMYATVTETLDSFGLFLVIGVIIAVIIVAKYFCYSSEKLRICELVHPITLKKLQNRCFQPKKSFALY